MNQPRPFYKRNAGGYVVPDGRIASMEVPPQNLKAPHSDNLQRLRQVAESYLGVRYRYGGQSRSGMDCSGFVRQAYAEALGIALPHQSASIAGLGESVSRSDLEIGDVVLFKNLLFIDHSGIYMGQNWFIHSQSGQGVVYTRLDAPYFGSHYAGARRFLTAKAGDSF